MEVVVKTKRYLTEDDLGEAAQFILESYSEGGDPLALLIEAEEQADEVFFAELERLLKERKGRRKPKAKRATFH